MMAQVTLRHGRILERFFQLLNNNRLAHAYLFTGPFGVGKFETAINIAKLLNCERSEKDVNAFFCNGCPSCKKITSGNHPDLHILSCARGETIKIEDVRQLTVQTQYRSFEAKWKIFIIKNSENLTSEGANALLKTLEEPSSDSLFILTSALPERNLPTIRSRCHNIFFAPEEFTELADSMSNDYHIDSAKAYFLASFTEGSRGRVKDLNEDNFLVKKNEIIDNLVFSSDSESFLKKISGEKDQLKQMLEILLSWFRDVLVMKLGVALERLTHQDRMQDLKRCERAFTEEDLEGIVKELVKTNKLLNDNLNVKIALALVKEKIWVR